MRLIRGLFFLASGIMRHNVFARQQQQIGPPNMPRQQRTKLLAPKFPESKKKKLIQKKPNYTVLEQSTKPWKQTCGRANQPHGAKLKKT